VLLLLLLLLLLLHLVATSQPHKMKAKGLATVRLGAVHVPCKVGQGPPACRNEGSSEA
jgi:hypothetical protein